MRAKGTGKERYGQRTGNQSIRSRVKYKDSLKVSETIKSLESIYIRMKNLEQVFFSISLAEKSGIIFF